MPVFDQGYRPYEGEIRSRFFRWWPISWTGLRAIRKVPFIIVLVLGAIPLIVKLVQAYGTQSIPMLAGQFPFDDTFFFEAISWETFWVVLLLMIVGSGQIADDNRTGALQLYFSKPITQLDYVLGKLGTVVLAASLLTAVPGLLALLAACLFSPDWTFLVENPLLPLKILGFSALVSVVLGMFVLGLSSLARRGRYVAIGFVGVYILSAVVGQMLRELLDDTRWDVVKLEVCLDSAGTTIFTNATQTAAPQGIAWAILGGILLLSGLLLARRVRVVEVVS